MIFDAELYESKLYEFELSKSTKFYSFIAILFYFNYNITMFIYIQKHIIYYDKHVYTNVIKNVFRINRKCGKI